jgi:hypothetical protein
MFTYIFIALLERPNVLECQTKARHALLVLTVIRVAVTAVAGKGRKGNNKIFSSKYL